MSVEQLSKSVIVVSSDIDDDEKRNALREYMMNQVQAEQRTESVYDFDLSECNYAESSIVKDYYNSRA